MELDYGATVGLALASHWQVGGMAFGRFVALGCTRLLGLERLLDVGPGSRRRHLRGGADDLDTEDARESGLAAGCFGMIC